MRLRRLWGGCGGGGGGPGTANVTGQWKGTYSTSLVPSGAINLNLTQSGTAVSGTFSNDQGGAGTVSGTVSGSTLTLTLNQTTAGCTGTFNGTATITGNTLTLEFTGTDCKGTHTDGQGGATRPGIPSVTIDWPLGGSVMDPDFMLKFTVQNWTVAQRETHFHLFLDGADKGPQYSLADIPLSGLADGTHTIALKLAESDGTLTGIQDQITVTVDSGKSPSVKIFQPNEVTSIQNGRTQVVFQIKNWTVKEMDTHFHYFLDGVDKGPKYTELSFFVSGLSRGEHTITLKLDNVDHTFTGVEDSVTFTY